MYSNWERYGMGFKELVRSLGISASLSTVKQQLTRVWRRSNEPECTCRSHQWRAGCLLVSRFQFDGTSYTCTVRLSIDVFITGTWEHFRPDCKFISGLSFGLMSLPVVQSNLKLNCRASEAMSFFDSTVRRYVCLPVCCLSHSYHPTYWPFDAWCTYYGLVDLR